MVTYKSKFNVIGYVKPYVAEGDTTLFNAEITSQSIEDPKEGVKVIHFRDRHPTREAAEADIHAKLAEIEDAFQMSMKSEKKKERNQSYGGK
jgi:hypothetical protein